MSLGNTLGRASGTTRSYIAHAAVASVKATGQFGTDFMAGDRDAYAEHSVRLAAIRAGAAPRSIKVSYTPLKAKTAKA